VAGENGWSEKKPFEPDQDNPAPTGVRRKTGAWGNACVGK